MIKKIALILTLLTAVSVIILPLTYSISYPQPHQTLLGIPFPGMTMSYQVYKTGEPPLLFSRMVTFYLAPSEPDCIWVRDSENQPEDVSDDRVAKIDIENRTIVGADSPSDDVQTGGYSEALFPTNLRIGDEVPTYWGGTVTIVGIQGMSVMGKRVNAWIAYTPEEWNGDISDNGAPVPVNYTMYYEVHTGIWLGGNVVSVWDETLHSWTMQLVSTNAPV